MNDSKVLLVSAVLVFTLFGCEDVGDHMEASGKLSGIINGKDIGYESWKGVVTVYALPTDTSCTGTLVAKDLVLTAGHCVYSVQYGIDFRQRPKDLVIWAGKDVYDTAARVDYGTADAVQVHPEWDGKDHSSDLALLRLSDPIEDATVEIYGLRSEPEPAVGDEAVIVGYGRSRDNDPESSGPQRMGSTSVRAIRVRPALGKHSMIRLHSDSMACTGDSGGPVFTEQDGQWVVTGVASMSDCFDDNANVNLLNHGDWLEGTMAEMSRFAGSKDIDTDEVDSGPNEDSEDAADTDTSADENVGDDVIEDASDPSRESGCNLSPSNSRTRLTVFKFLL